MHENSIFIHAAILDKCKEKVLHYLDLIKDSLLINNVDFVYICFVGSQVIPINDTDIEKYNNNKNIFIIKISENLLDYELPTLNFLYNFCKKKNIMHRFIFTYEKCGQRNKYLHRRSNRIYVTFSCYKLETLY